MNVQFSDFQLVDAGQFKDLHDPANQNFSLDMVRALREGCNSPMMSQLMRDMADAASRFHMRAV